jgi:hypothetical protein
MVSGFALSSVVRGLGPAVATLVPEMRRRRLVQAAVIAAADVAARRVGPPGFSFVSITPGNGKSFSLPQRAGAEAAGAGGFAAPGVLVLVGMERLPVPRPVRAVLAGTLVVAADVRARAFAARARAAAAAGAGVSDTAAPDGPGGS